MSPESAVRGTAPTAPPTLLDEWGAASDEPAPVLDARAEQAGSAHVASSGAHAAWSRVLDEIATMSAQAGPDAADEVIDRLTRWNPPTGLGRLPAELADRALEVLAGHAHVVELLQAAIGQNRRHARVLSAVPTGAPAAAYLDVQA